MTHCRVCWVNLIQYFVKLAFFSHRLTLTLIRHRRIAPVADHVDLRTTGNEREGPSVPATAIIAATLAIIAATLAIIAAAWAAITAVANAAEDAAAGQ